MLREVIIDYIPVPPCFKIVAINGVLFRLRREMFEVHRLTAVGVNRRQFIAPELTGKISPTRLEGINLRGIFRFPTERHAEQIMPSRPVEKTPLAA